MDEVELAKLFVEYAGLKKREAEIEVIIQAGVLELKKTCVIAGIKATYSKEGTETPDYEGIVKKAVDLHPSFQKIVDKFTSPNPTTRWKEVCEFMHLTVPPGAPKPASVKIKVV